MRNDKPQTRILSIYLLDKQHATSSDVLRNPRRLERHTFRLKGARGVELWVQRPQPSSPRWADFFEALIDRHQFGKTASSAAVLLLNVDSNRFAVTFGHGRHLLDPGAYDERFGLRTTLNCIDPRQLRSLDKDTFENVARHSREQVARSTDISGFGVNVEQDLVRAVEGSPDDGSPFGSRLAGRDALHATVRITLGELPGLLRKYAIQASSTSYKTHFPWVDTIHDVRSPSQVAALNERLVALLNDDSSRRIWLTPPVVTDWPNQGFRYGDSDGSPVVAELRLAEFLADSFPDGDVTVEALKRRHIAPLGVDSVPVDRWTGYQCLYAEIEEGSRVYLLSAGRWYEIDKDFVRSVTEGVAGIPQSQLVLPDCRNEEEKAYNQRVAASSSGRIQSLDRHNVFHGGGHSQVEVCDLYTEARQIVHVKNYDNSSSALSHLFAQARVSAELLLEDREYREKLNEKLLPAFRLPAPEERPNPSEFEIVFAIISRSAGTRDLPFFSRVNLRQTYRALTAYGYFVSVANVRRIQEA